MKICNTCKIEKEIDDFYKDLRTKKDGRYGHCKKCHNVYSTNWQKKNPGPGRIRARKWYKDNPGKPQIKVKKYRLNPDYMKKENKWNATYKRNNKAKINAINAGRRALNSKATPLWLTKHMRKDIEFFFLIRQEMQSPKDWNIDHYYPLSGDGYTGLHVPWNLRLLKTSENISKKNKLPDPLPLVSELYAPHISDFNQTDYKEI